MDTQESEQSLPQEVGQKESTQHSFNLETTSVLKGWSFEVFDRFGKFLLQVVNTDSEISGALMLTEAEVELWTRTLIQNGAHHQK